MNSTGIGVARQSPPLPPDQVFTAIDAHVQAKAPAESVRRGLATFRANCMTCHVPLQCTSLGFNTAPDLSTVTARLDDPAIRRTITEGRVQKGMLPWPGLGEAAVGDLVAWFHWLHDERAAIRARVPGDASNQGLPWWECR